MNNYSRDEALRVTGLTVMLENHTYTFNVHNSRGRFLVILTKHEFPKGFFEEHGKCCAHTSDPCGMESHDIKLAAWESIAEHNKQVHYLKSVP